MDKEKAIANNKRETFERWIKKNPDCADPTTIGAKRSERKYLVIRLRKAFDAGLLLGLSLRSSY